MVDRLVRSACLLEEIRLHCAYTYAIHYVTHAAAAGYSNCPICNFLATNERTEFADKNETCENGKVRTLG